MGFRAGAFRARAFQEEFLVPAAGFGVGSAGLPGGSVFAVLPPPSGPRPDVLLAPGVAGDGHPLGMPNLPAEVCKATQEDTQGQGLDHRPGQEGNGEGARGGSLDVGGKGDGGEARGHGHYGFYGQKGHSQYYAPVVGHSLSVLFPEIQGVSGNIDSKFNLLQIQLDDLKKEMSVLRSEVITKKRLEELEARIFKLESREVSMRNPDD